MLPIFSKQQKETDWDPNGVQYCARGGNDGVPPPNTNETFDSKIRHQIIIVLNLLALEHLKGGRRDAVVVELQTKNDKNKRQSLEQTETKTKTTKTKPCFTWCTAYKPLKTTR